MHRGWKIPEVWRIWLERSPVTVLVRNNHVALLFDHDVNFYCLKVLEANTGLEKLYYALSRGRRRI